MKLRKSTLKSWQLRFSCLRLHYQAQSMLFWADRMNLLSQILQWIFRALKLNVKRYPAKLYHKTRADFIAKIHDKTDKTDKDKKD